jgi:uncharacterized protein
MTTETPEPAEPTMEEILASIRQIIATDEPPADAATHPATNPEDDILELTELVEEPGAVAEVEVAAEELLPTAPEAEAVRDEPMMAEESALAMPATEEGALVSADIVAQSAGAFASLTEELENRRITLPSHVEVGDGKQTLEQLVTQIMRPLLKEWLETNLPTTVERLVQKEIERIARQHRDGI